jgi:hypothetical protein
MVPGLKEWWFTPYILSVKPPFWQEIIAEKGTASESIRV